MTRDITCDTIERAIAEIIPSGEMIALACNTPELDDNYEGWLVQCRCETILATTNDGTTPVLCDYALEIDYITSSEVAQARQVMSSSALKDSLSRELQITINNILGEGLSLFVVNIASATSEVSITETRRNIFASNFNITCQPCLVEEGD